MRTVMALAVALMIVGAPAVVSGTIVFSPILGTENAEDTFTCAFVNTHLRKNAGVSFLIFELNTEQVVAEDGFELEAGALVAYTVNGPGRFICLYEAKGGTVRSQVNLNAEGRSDEVQQVK